MLNRIQQQILQGAVKTFFIELPQRIPSGRGFERESNACLVCVRLQCFQSRAQERVQAHRARLNLASACEQAQRA